MRSYDYIINLITNIKDLGFHNLARIHILKENPTFLAQDKYINKQIKIIELHHLLCYLRKNTSMDFISVAFALED